MAAKDEMRKGRFLTTGAVLVILLAGSVAAVSPQTSDDPCRYFANAGHSVCDEFLTFYDTRGGLEIFGNPLTEAFDDPMRGLRVQYFQRARMEWHPNNPDPYKVQLGLLVDELGISFPPARQEQIPAFNSSLHHYFPETGHVVSYAFLQYFREKGGLDIFGYPRSEFMYLDGYIVQYFQRARMEWHPEAAEGAQMRLTNLVENNLDQFGIPAQALEPVGEAGSGAPRPLTRLDASASVRYVITGRQGTQTVFVYVNDQWQNPVQGAAVSATVHYQPEAQTYGCGVTNASGFTRCSFGIDSPPPGRKVVVDVTVTYGGLTTTTQTFFLPWW